MDTGSDISRQKTGKGAEKKRMTREMRVEKKREEKGRERA